MCVQVTGPSSGPEISRACPPVIGAGGVNANSTRRPGSCAATTYRIGPCPPALPGTNPSRKESRGHRSAGHTRSASVASVPNRSIAVASVPGTVRGWMFTRPVAVVVVYGVAIEPS